MEGRLKIGTEFLKLGSLYLRIGPASAFAWLTGSQGLPATSVSFMVTNPGGVNRVLFLGVVTTHFTATVPDIPVITGDLTWTQHTTQTITISTGVIRHTVFTAILGAGDPDPDVIVTCSIEHFLIDCHVFGVSSLNTASPVVQAVAGQTSGTPPLAPYTINLAAFANGANFGFVLALSGSGVAGYAGPLTGGSLSQNGYWVLGELDPEIALDAGSEGDTATAFELDAL